MCYICYHGYANSVTGTIFENTHVCIGMAVPVLLLSMYTDFANDFIHLRSQYSYILYS